VSIWGRFLAIVYSTQKMFQKNIKIFHSPISYKSALWRWLFNLCLKTSKSYVTNRLVWCLNNVSSHTYIVLINIKTALFERCLITSFFLSTSNRFYK